MKPIDVLKKYWGYEAFRPSQQEIIEHVLEGKDAVAVLPTGGGKSICFQVPALAKEGLCIVVSPLVALMKDQVHQLNERGISALSITSELSHTEIDARFDRCVYDQSIKFLYLSPERLKTDIAKARIPKMPVSLIAIDEAHCISEWGYDFRPSYLEIVSIRSMLPNTPLLALTASATPDVIQDIAVKLEIKGDNTLFKRSFTKDNLSYYVEWNENKLAVIERIIQKQKGSGIIYMRSRKGTERIAKALAQRNINANYYHAGLSAEERTARQSSWMTSEDGVIASTNAFGMGIDKGNVRFVIHLDVPDTMENYYQECGRAGRDGEKAFAVSILTPPDVLRARENFEQRFPSKEDIRKTYAAIADHLKLAVGSGKDETFPIDLDVISDKFKLNRSTIHNSLYFLEKEGYLLTLENSSDRSQLQFIASHRQMMELRASRLKLDALIESSLRSYPRIFEEPVGISEWTICRRAHMSKDEVINGLLWMHESGFANYQKSTGLPRITFTEERIAPKNLRISEEHYLQRKRILKEKTEAMIHYYTNEEQCRSRLISNYFGEYDTNDCGICDVCIRRKQ